MRASASSRAYRCLLVSFDNAYLLTICVDDAVHVLMNAFDGVAANLHFVPPVGILAVADVALNNGG